MTTPSKPLRLGMLTPSSNTVLEPFSYAMVADTPEITLHFQRFQVLRIGTDASALKQFDNAKLIEAALLLTDAKVDTICWNGTSGGWLGLDADRKLCAEITAATGVPATTSTLALAEAFKAAGVKRYGLVTPYLHDVQAKIIETFGRQGFYCAVERHLNDPGNYSFATFGEEIIDGMLHEAAAEKPDAIAVFCTNFRGTRLAHPIEAETGVKVFDSIALALWHSLILGGGDPARIRGWGRLFDLQPAVV